MPKFNAIKCKEIMQALEDNPKYPSPLFFVHNVNLWGQEQIQCDGETIYNCVQLYDGMLIVGEMLNISDADHQAFRADRLTSLGHDVLAKMNDTSVWPKIKEAMSNIRSTAEFLTALAPFFPMGWIDSLAHRIFSQT